MAAKVHKAGGRKGGFNIVKGGRKIGWSATKRRAKARAKKA
jgi:hypothetical protein